MYTQKWKHTYLETAIVSRPLEIRPTRPENITFTLDFDLIAARLLNSADKVPETHESAMVYAFKIAGSLDISELGFATAGVENPFDVERNRKSAWSVLEKSLSYTPKEIKDLFDDDLKLGLDDSIPGFILASPSKHVKIWHSGISLRSPMFDWTNPHWNRQVSDVIKAVSTGDFRAGGNEGTILSVHLGVGLGKTMSLSALQKIMAVFILGESALESLCGVQSGSDRLNRDLQHFLGKTNDEVFNIIMAQNSVEDLHKAVNSTPVLTGTGCRTMWNNKLNTLLHIQSGTIEIRIHPSSLFSHQIEMWVGLLSNLVCNAAAAESEQLRRWLTNKPMDSQSLLKNLVKCPRVCEYYSCVQSGNSSCGSLISRVGLLQSHGEFPLWTREYRSGRENEHSSTSKAGKKRQNSVRKAVSSAALRFTALAERKAKNCPVFGSLSLSEVNTKLMK